MADTEHEHHGVEATVVGVDPSIEPIKSVVVGDRRYNLGKRLGIAAFVLLLLFFTINGYVQSAKNGAQLTRAAKDRSGLIHTLNAQTDLIQQLQLAIEAQNQELRSHGLKVVKIPTSKTTTRYLPSPRPEPQPNPQPSSSPTHHPKPKPSPKPSPSPTDTVHDTICKLTGICLPLHVFQFMF